MHFQLCAQAYGRVFADKGVRHVVAVDYEERIRDDAAILFTQTLYKHLFAGSTVCQAFEMARLGVRQNSRFSDTEANKFLLIGADGARHQRALPFCAALSSGCVVDCTHRPVGIPRNTSTYVRAARQIEMHLVMDAMRRCQNRVISLVGVAGVGKSTLLISCIEYLSDRACAFAWVCTLAPVTLGVLLFHLTSNHCVALQFPRFRATRCTRTTRSTLSASYTAPALTRSPRMWRAHCASEPTSTHPRRSPNC